MSDTIFYAVKNNHVDSCGYPPNIDTEKNYTSYYQNIHGEQCVFVGDVKAEIFTLRGGDIGWDNPKSVDLNSKKIEFDLILNTGEQFWFRACFFTFMSLVMMKNKEYDAYHAMDKETQNWLAAQLKENKVGK